MGSQRILLESEFFLFPFVIIAMKFSTKIFHVILGFFSTFRPSLSPAEEATRMARLEQELKFLPERKRSKLFSVVRNLWAY